MAFFVFILALLAIGFALKRVGLSPDFAKALNQFVIYVSLPATVLLLVPKIQFDATAFALALTPWVLLPVSVGLVWLLTRHQPKEVRAALLLVVPLGNTSFLGFPMITALVGAEGVQYALIYDQLGSFLILSVYGTMVIAHYQTGYLDGKVIVKKIITFPPAIALTCALLMGELPSEMIPYLQRLADTLVPLALISVGYSLTHSNAVNYPLLGVSLTIKLLVLPLLAFAFLSLWNLNDMAMEVAVLSSAMPSMITAGALAIAAGFAPALSAAMVGYGILLSLVILPLIHYGMSGL
jgi:predicted permease